MIESKTLWQKKADLKPRVHQVLNTDVVRPLFGEWHKHFIAPCLQGMMGEAYADGTSEPKSAVALLCDFAFLAGEPNGPLLQFSGDGAILVPQNDGWSNLITEYYGEKAQRFTRYAMRDNAPFDRPYLEKLVNQLPEGDTLELIDEAAYDRLLEHEWGRDLVANFKDYPSYQKLGLGVVIRKEGVVVAGASSYCRAKDSMEIEIDTREDCRRQGLATICGAKLILECLDRGIYPNWDAHDLRSVALAKKLGYEVDYAYQAFELAEGVGNP